MTASKATIKFGTSGWRAIIADEFTFANVGLVTEAIAQHVGQRSKTPTLLVGYDTRFASDSFANQVAQVLSAADIRVQLCSRPTPTPAVSFAVRHRKLDGAINLTASHNAGEYNGIKFSGQDGAPALPEVTAILEAEIRSLQASDWEFSKSGNPDLIRSVDIRDEYLNDLATKVDFDVIRNSGIRIAYDPLYGVGSGHLDHILRTHQIEPRVIHSERDVYFGECDHPEPDEANLSVLRQTVIEEGLTLGLGNDGDADRFGVLDSNGDYISPNEVLSLLLDYLIESRGWDGAVARTVATTHLIDRVAELHGREVIETPVGFKYIGQFIEQGRIIMGGEESAGLAIRGHLPEKDGILACLLVAEMVAKRGKSLTSQKKDLFERTGAVYNRRLNIRLAETDREAIREKIASDVQEFFGRPVDRVDRTDGLKLIFPDGSWVLMRPSGTEPVIRYYAEAGTVEELGQLIECGKKWTTV
jgi:phosphoglucomutase